MHHIRFSSSLPAEYFEDLVALLFFNPQQQMAGRGVVKSIEQFGTPEISVCDGRLSITLGQSEVQPLFALAGSGGVGSGDRAELAGLVLYLRTDTTNIIVLHVAVTERFSSVGTAADAVLVMRLLKAVVDCARRLGGVRYITILYTHAAKVVHVRRPEVQTLSAKG